MSYIALLRRLLGGPTPPAPPAVQSGPRVIRPVRVFSAGCER